MVVYDKCNQSISIQIMLFGSHENKDQLKY
jgi:hypothetical protein